MKKVLYILAIIGMGLASCNSNDDDKGIEIDGITITDDADCCSAEEALAVYNFLQTLHPVGNLSFSIDELYDVQVYSSSSSLHVGYNDLYFVATKKSSGNYIKFLDVANLSPLMQMSGSMSMKHSTPAGNDAGVFDSKVAAVKHTWVSFLMPTSENGNWTLSLDIEVLKSKATIENVPVEVAALPDGQAWVKSFKADDKTYYLSLVNPTEWETGENTIKAYVSEKAASATTAYPLASARFTIDIDPRMPDMGNHTSPDNVSLTRQTDGSYEGKINLTMTGLWRIHLTVKDSSGNIVAGGDDLSDGYSSLFWDVTI